MTKRVLTVKNQESFCLKKLVKKPVKYVAVFLPVKTGF